MNLKKFEKLGMNIDSDSYILPKQYTAIPQPYYKGKGEHSVTELEQLCENFKEYCHQQSIIKATLIQEIKNP